MEWRNRTSTFTGSIIALLVPAFALVTAAGAATKNGSQRTDPTGRLGIWEGRWSYSTRDYATPYSHAHTSHGAGDCNWAPNRGFMICDYFNRDPGSETPLNDLVIFSYSPAAKAYTHVRIFKDAKPVLDKVTVNGNTWITSVEIPYHGKTIIYRDVYVFSSDNEVRNTTAQVSADKGQTWTTVTQFTAAKVRQTARRHNKRR
jgi:hypothetical protein